VGGASRRRGSDGSFFPPAHSPPLASSRFFVHAARTLTRCASTRATPRC
jgi:hypothetical protein